MTLTVIISLLAQLSNPSPNRRIALSPNQKPKNILNPTPKPKRNVANFFCLHTQSI